MSQINDFHKQLKHSESAEGLTLISGTINRLYPDHILIQEVLDLEFQARGLDKIIHLENGEVIGVEHKIRETIYTDIALEYLSNNIKGTKGWMEKDLICDLFIYGWNPLQETYTFYWKELKQVWETNKREWMGKHKVIKAQNYGYCTYSIAVPIEKIVDKLSYYHYKV